MARRINYIPRTAKIALALAVVWAVASTGGCVALYTEMQEKEEKWAEERTALANEVAVLKDRNATLDRNIVALNIDLAGLRKSGKGLTELQSMIKAAENKLQTATARRENTVVEAAAAKRSLSAANQSLAETRKALDDHKTRIARRRAEIEAAEARLDDLRRAAKAADARIDEARNTLAKLKTDIIAREKDMQAMETNLQSARTSLDGAIDRIDKVRKPGS
jgi:chromosome segregation ATPase